eukprot:scpid57888/ scgid29874/ 
MPNSRARKKRLAEKQRKESKQVNVERRMSTCSMNPAMLQGCKDGGGRRRMSMGCSTRIRSDSSSSDGADSCPEGEMDGPNSGLFTSAVSWFSYGLDYVIPSRKLVRELEETKERLKAAEDQLKKREEKSTSLRQPGRVVCRVAVALLVTDGASTTCTCTRTAAATTTSTADGHTSPQAPRHKAWQEICRCFVKEPRLLTASCDHRRPDEDQAETCS